MMAGAKATGTAETLPPLTAEIRDCDVAALAQMARDGAQFVLLYPKLKRPIGEDWQHRRVAWSAAERHLQSGGGVGLLLIDGATDCDLDSEEAIALAPEFLPATGCIFGRDGARRSHWLYRCTPVATYAKFRDPMAPRDHATLVELRASSAGEGRQTMMPGSIHPNGERVTFDAAEAPTAVDAAVLTAAVADLAVACLLGRHWPARGSRHDAALALSGFLLRGGLDDARTLRIVCGAARVGSDEEWRARPAAVESTAAGLRDGRPVTGGRTLVDLLGDKIVTAIGEWLGLRRGVATSSPAPAADAQGDGTAPGAGDADTPPPLRWRTARAIGESTPPEVPWRLKPYVADGALTEIDGKIKIAGKTTLVSRMTAAVLDGADFLGSPTVKTAVVWLTEQPDTSLRPVLERAGLLERDDLVILSYWDACHLAWPEIVAAAVQEATEIGARLVVVDTLSQFAGFEGDTENNVGDAQRALKPLQIAATTHKLAVVILRHEKKADADVGDAARGSTAIGGAVDVILSLRRVPGMPPTVRRLLGLSRFSETPDDTCIELTEDGYVLADVAGVKAARTQEKTAEQRRQLLAVLPTDPDARRLVAELVTATGIAKSTVNAILLTLCGETLVDRTRDVGGQHPYRYWRLGDVVPDADAETGADAEKASTEASEKASKPSRASRDAFVAEGEPTQTVPSSVGGTSSAHPKLLGKGVPVGERSSRSDAFPEDDGPADGESF